MLSAPYGCVRHRPALKLPDSRGMVADAHTCSATTKAGTPCRGRALPGSPYCLAHAPERQTTLAEARRKGGRGKASAARARRELLAAGAMDAEMVLAAVGVAMRRLLAGRVEASVVSAMATASRAWFSGRDTLLLEDVERRLAMLEAAEKDVHG